MRYAGARNIDANRQYTGSTRLQVNDILRWRDDDLLFVLFLIDEGSSASDGDRFRHRHGVTLRWLEEGREAGGVGHVAVDRACSVILRNEYFPFDDGDRHVHLRQRHYDVAFLLERRPGVNVDERHRVRTTG